MPALAIVYGLALSILGIGAYMLSDTKSITSLIPLFFGAPVIVCGIIARNEKLRMHAMHVAVLLALLGFLGTVSGLVNLPLLLSGAAIEKPLIVATKGIMSLTSLVFLVFCIKSFIEARKSGAVGKAA